MLRLAVVSGHATTVAVLLGWASAAEWVAAAAVAAAGGKDAAVALQLLLLAAALGSRLSPDMVHVLAGECVLVRWVGDMRWGA